MIVSHNPKIELYNADCLQYMATMPDSSVDVILTDPPYLYLKNQKLEREFDEKLFFSEAKRILKKDGFIVLFGRGTSFYRWNTLLADLGFNFKEEIVWNKSYCSSPLMALSRVHETVSIHTKGKGTINKVKVPYLEMKGHDLDSIVQDIKRLKTTFKNTKSLDAVLEYLSNNGSFCESDSHGHRGKHKVNHGEFVSENRCVSVSRSISEGMNEKTIVRVDRHNSDNFTKHHTTADKRQSGNRACDVFQSICAGMNEKTIIKQGREHYDTIHPTQKPIRLLERLVALVSKEGDVVFDPFAGSGSTLHACRNTGRIGIGCEIDAEYYQLAVDKFKKQHAAQTQMF